MQPIGNLLLAAAAANAVAAVAAAVAVAADHARVQITEITFSSFSPTPLLTAAPRTLRAAAPQHHSY